MRQWLVANLGNYESQHNYNPFKLMWFVTTGSDYASYLFDNSGNLTNPVGQQWNYEHGLPANN
jgi:hypothetical protein